MNEARPHGAVLQPEGRRFSGVRGSPKSNKPETCALDPWMAQGDLQEVFEKKGGKPMSKRAMSLKDACELVPDDLPDGAYWQMAHDIAGADYGEAWHELGEQKPKKIKNHKCPDCNKRFEKDAYMRQHKAAAHDRPAKNAKKETH